MTGIEQRHADMVEALCKPGKDIVASMTPADAELLHMAVGICTEAGELLSAVKATVVYGKPLDFENIIEELGDLEFYMAGVRRSINVTRKYTLAANCDKLGERYKSGAYSDREAIERADKAEQEAQS